MTRIFKIPFATQGDRTTVPVETQADGSVSYSQGYGYDYERDQETDPAAKDIERDKMNDIFHDTTEAIGEMQTFGAAKWSKDGTPYPIMSLVYHDDKLWQSTIVNNNTEPAADNSDWAQLSASIRNTISAIYPVGIVTFFAADKDPNTLFPGTVWTYIGEDKVIRLGKKDASDVRATGGSDTVTLTTANMPAHNHTFSATTSSFDYGTKTSSTFDYGGKETSTNGSHTHGLQGRYGNYATPSTYVAGGAVGTEFLAVTAYSGSHTHTISIGAHYHTVPIGSHSHNFSGSTGGVGAGQNFSVMNSYIKLMGWYRTA